MPSTARSESLPWLIGGAAFLAVLLVFGWYARQAGDRTSQLASHAARVDLVARMQRDLASAAEAEKSAVLATTDAESLAFADKARASTADVEREQQELGNLLTVGGAPHESDLLAQFSSLTSGAWTTRCSGSR
jgi:hypothetical protein